MIPEDPVRIQNKYILSPIPKEDKIFQLNPIYIKPGC